MRARVRVVGASGGISPPQTRALFLWMAVEGVKGGVAVENSNPQGGVLPAWGLLFSIVTLYSIGRCPYNAAQRVGGATLDRRSKAVDRVSEIGYNGLQVPVVAKSKGVVKVSDGTDRVRITVSSDLINRVDALVEATGAPNATHLNALVYGLGVLVLESVVVQARRGSLLPGLAAVVKGKTDAYSVAED